MTIGDLVVSRGPNRELVFERDGYEITMRQTVGDRATLTFSCEGAVIGKVTGVRMDPEVLVGVVTGALLDDTERYPPREVYRGPF